MTTSLENIATLEELRDHAGELVESVAGSGEPLFITVAGQSKVVLVDLEQFKELERLRQGAQLLKILEDRYDRAKRDGTFLTVEEAFDDIEKSLGWRQ